MQSVVPRCTLTVALLLVLLFAAAATAEEAQSSAQMTMKQADLMFRSRKYEEATGLYQTAVKQAEVEDVLETMDAEHVNEIVEKLEQAGCPVRQLGVTSLA